MRNKNNWINYLVNKSIALQLYPRGKVLILKRGFSHNIVSILKIWLRPNFSVTNQFFNSQLLLFPSLN